VDRSGRPILAILAALAAVKLATAQPFSVRLPALSDAWLPGGSPEVVLRLPEDKFQEIQVRLSPPWSERIQAGDIEVNLDGNYPHPTRSTGGEGVFLSIRTQEIRGLLPNPEHHLIITTPNPSVRTQWTILRWDKAYAQVSGIARGGTPPGIRIDQPPGGVVLLGNNSSTVRLSGEVAGGLEIQLIIQSQRIGRIASKPGFQFDAQIPVAANAKEVVVSATDDGNITTLVLPVRPISR
jgi:hypothetical protein